MILHNRVMDQKIGRMAWIDDCKAVAAWLVVTSHLIRQGILTDYLAALSVAMFWILAGVTMHRHSDASGFAGRLVRRIVIPYLVVGGISIAVYRVLGDYAAERLGAEGIRTTLWEDLLHLLYGSSVAGRMKWNESLWFLPCYVLVILMAECVERMGEEKRLLRGVLYTVPGAMGYVMIRGGVMGLPWHLETALLVLPLCGGGRILGEVLERRARSAAAHKRPLSAAGIGAVCLYIGTRCYGIAERTATGGSLSLRAVHLADPVSTYGFLLLGSVGMILIIKGITDCVPLPVLSYVGERSLAVVLWNKFPVLVLQVIVPALVPSLGAWFIGEEDLRTLAVALSLAIPCVAACLLFRGIYKGCAVRLRGRYRK